MACENTEFSRPFHEKYGLSKTREAEDMCNYSQYLKEEAIEKRNLKLLERMEACHYNDLQIMEIMEISVEQLKSLREKFQEMHAAVMAE